MKFNGRNVYISPGAKIGNNVKIGDNSSIYDNVIIKENSIIANDCIIGEPLTGYYSDALYENPETIINEDSLIRSHTIIYANCVIGKGFSTGHRVTIRENSKIGAYCKIGTGSDLQGNLVIGDYCWLHSNVHVGQNTELGNFIFVYPNVVFTNDPYPPSNLCNGPSVDDYTQIATSCVILPGIEIGKHAFIGAGSVVTKNVNNFQLFVGNPAKFVKDVREIRLKKTGQPYYPWPDRFSRGMPWEGMTYDEWLMKME